MKLKLHISTCPNDTFMFHAMLHGAVDCEGLEFDVQLSDIEALNREASAGVADVSKISCAMIPTLMSTYRVLQSGSALGFGNGPVVIAAQSAGHEILHGAVVAVPGTHTTACLLMKRLFPQIAGVREYLFYEIQEAVRSGECAVGVLIHEERFTFAQQGLYAVADLGQEWEERYHLPLPLGSIVVSRRLSDSVQQRIDRVLRRSIDYGFAHPEASRAFIKAYARELSDEVIDRHIALFVNDYSRTLGAEGRRAVTALTALDPQDLFVHE